MDVQNFDKVIVSPHIQVTFRQGEKESVTIEHIAVPMKKFNVEVDNGTLWVYLEGAKIVTKSEKVDNDQWKGKRSIYQGTKVKAIVTYKNLTQLSLRGEETFICESPLQTEDFKLKIYGESRVFLNKVQFAKLQTAIYGESYLEIKEGSIEKQKFTAYGESVVNTLAVANRNTKITAYGESSFRVNVEKELKVTAYGEATIAYTGNADVNKGIIIGNATVQEIN